MKDKNSIKLVTLGGECFEAIFQRETEDPLGSAVYYHFHIIDMAKNRGKRLVSVVGDITLQVVIAGYESRVGIVCLNVIRRAFDSGVLSFDSPFDDRHYQQLPLGPIDLQKQLAKPDSDVRQHIIHKAYWLAYRSPVQAHPDDIIYPIPFDDGVDLDYLGVEASDIRRIVGRLANQGLLERVLEGNARPTEKLLSDYELKAGRGLSSDTSSGAWPQAAGGSDDRKFASLAIEEARKSVSEEDERPHPKVGAVVVKNGQVLSSAHRGEAVGNHAEFIALEKKLPESTVAGATVYTTLEPCTTRNHPKIPCARRLIERKVARVVVGMLDPDSRITGRGLQALRDANIAIDFFPPDLMTVVEELNREFKRYHSPPDKSASQATDEEAPTLPLLMKRDFPTLHQLHGKPVLAFENEIPLHIDDTLYVDFVAGSKFVGFYVPASPKTFEICVLLALHARQLGDELAQSLLVVSKAPGENPQDVKALVYTGRVYLYHQDMLTHRQVVDIEDAFQKQGLNVVLRGPDYLSQACVGWKRKTTGGRS